MSTAIDFATRVTLTIYEFLTNMFRDEETAFAIKEHMLNAIWLISASAHRSPILECTEEEQLAYAKIVDKICQTIDDEIILPICDVYPNLIDTDDSRYKRFHRINREV